MSLKKNNEKHTFLNIFTTILTIGDIIAIACFVLVYGPWGNFKDILITTAMKTMSHQYLAYILYDEKTVEEVMKNNYFVEIKEDANINEIKINTQEKQIYENEYEQELLTRDEGNDLYKLLNIKVGNANGYLVAIYKPEKVKLIRTKAFNVGTAGERVVDMCSRYGGIVCINGGGFANGLDNGSDIPLGYVIDDGKIVWKTNNTGNIIGITYDGKLKLMYNTTGEEAINSGIKYGLEFGPFLIINGKSAEIVGFPYGVANKCVIAQRQDGIILFLVTEGETYVDGASLKDVIEILEKYGAYNAANLDGGQSTSLVINNKLINSPNYLAKKQGGRYVVTGFGLIND